MSAANINGWGRSTWGAGTWSNPIPVDATGLAGTTALNNATIVTTQQIQFTVTGSAGTGAVGNVVAGGAGALVSETGLLGTVSFGDESVVGTALVSATGVAGTSAVGTTTVSTVTGVSVTSFELVGALGNVSIPVDTVGLSATGNIGNVTIWQEVVPSTTTNWIEVAA